MRVFKYRGILDRDLLTLASDEIFLARIETLNDPFEAKIIVHGEEFQLGQLITSALSQPYSNAVAAADQESASALKNFLDQSKSWGVYSLSKTPEDELMWAHYGDSHRGFCIEYNLDELLAFSLSEEAIIDVVYSVDPPTITITDLLHPNRNSSLVRKILGTKSLSWKHEEEIRIISGAHGSRKIDYRSVKGIYFGARSDSSFREKAMQELRGRNINYYLMSVMDQSYGIVAHPLADPYTDTPPYREHIAPVEEGAIFLDEKNSRFEKQLQEVIELARREPYCERVTHADISTSKGIVDEPVFYVGYRRTDGLLRNLYYVEGKEGLVKYNV